MIEPLPIVLVPGLLTSARLYGEQIPALWHYGPVTVADHTRDNRMTSIAGRILATAPPRFALVGLSMGGYLAFEMLRQAPDRVARLALLDTTARPDTPQQTERRHALIALAQSGRLAEVADQLFPLLISPARHGDPDLRRLVRLMADETGPEAFICQQKGDHDPPRLAARAHRDRLPDAGAGRRRRRVNPAGAVRRDRQRHPPCTPGRGARLRTPVDPGAAAPRHPRTCRMAPRLI